MPNDLVSLESRVTPDLVARRSSYEPRIRVHEVPARFLGQEHPVDLELRNGLARGISAHIHSARSIGSDLSLQ